MRLFLDFFLFFCFIFTDIDIPVLTVKTATAKNILDVSKDISNLTSEMIKRNVDSGSSSIAYKRIYKNEVMESFKQSHIDVKYVHNIIINLC